MQATALRISLTLKSSKQHKKIKIKAKTKAKKISSTKYLRELNEASEIHRPSGEEENEYMRSRDHTKNNQRVGEVNAGDDGETPGGIEDREGPGINAPRPVPPPQEVDPLYHLPLRMKPRHPSRI